VVHFESRSIASFTSVHQYEIVVRYLDHPMENQLTYGHAAVCCRLQTLFSLSREFECLGIMAELTTGQALFGILQMSF
jgi:hypothetical protein